MIKNSSPQCFTAGLHLWNKGHIQEIFRMNPTLYVPKTREPLSGITERFCGQNYFRNLAEN
jgi:hypothetical protein